MVTVEEAIEIINAFPFQKQAEMIPIEQAVGRILAGIAHADRDFPPFNRVAMDGIAISYDQWLAGKRNFEIEGVQAAGEIVKTLLDSAKCMEVMTGAVIPNGTDTVIRYEDATIKGQVAEVTLEKLERGQNVHHQGVDAAKGEKLLEPGALLSPAEIALFAAVGLSRVPVYRFPTAAIISSGDELVDINETPAPHQIRRSNTFALESAMREMGWIGTKFHFPDNKNILTEKIAQLISKYDVLILSGGISKGKFDYIPDALAAAGVEKKFQWVKQRPGKPFWFGVTESGKVVFALPGNPVSTYMCFYRYIKPWILKSFDVSLPLIEVTLGGDIHFPPPLTYFLQVKLKLEGGLAVAIPAPGGGSGDFANLKDVTGFIQLPPNKTAFKSGEVYPYIPFRTL